MQHKSGKSNSSFDLKDHIFLFYLNQNRHLERARIVFAIENEMSTEERNLPTNKYWTNIDDERYLQVEEVNDQCFRDVPDEDGEDKKEDDSKKADDEFV